MPQGAFCCDAGGFLDEFVKPQAARSSLSRALPNDIRTRRTHTMALELRQQLKLSQQLVMTPQLQQAIKLLQLSKLELLDTVQNELLENPLLEENLEPAPDQEQAREQESQEAAEREWDLSGVTPRSEEELAKNAEWDDYLGDFASTSRQATVRENPDDAVSFEARLSGARSLEGHLAWQLRLSRLSEEEICVGEAIICNLDSAGYLQASTEELAALTHSDPETVERVLQLVQRLDPVGVAARTPAECLLVQLELHEMDDPVLVELVREHLEDLEKRRYKPLARKFRISMDELKEYLDVIKTLDPMPGASYGSEEPLYVAPDVQVFKYGDEFVIALNDEDMPRLSLNTELVDNLPAKAEKDKEYFQEKMRSAVWLMKSLYQRQRTLYKVTESVVKHQREFFEHGVTQLKPLILKDIADDIGMHESTVSRITTNKYVATPHGVFELKFFFNSALGMDDGSQVGSESVKALIKKMVAEEDPRRPLSDEKIAEVLKKELQVNIARRTVAKYRSALNIASSSKRKQVF